MGFRHGGALLACMALSAPAAAFDASQTAVFYVSIPLERQAAPLSFGLRLQGRDYPAVNIDTQMLRFVSLGGIEAQWLLAGALAVGAAAAIQGDKRAEQQAAASAPQRAPAAEPCPQACK